MSMSECCRAVDPRHQARSRHRARNLTVMLVLGGGISVILYYHGAEWWYGPLAVLAAVLAHMAILGGILLVAARLTRTYRGPDGAACCREATAHTHAGESMLIRRPRLYDWLMRVITLGRERKLRQRILDLADLQPGAAILDVGCGTGTLLLAAAERVGPSAALHGLEPAAEMVVHAQRKAEARGISLQIIEGSADSLPYPSGSFDTVFCTLVLHHLPGSMQSVAIREMRRVLRPEGRVVIVDLRRSRSLAKAITAAMSLVSLLHNLSPSTSRFDVLAFEPLMTELGFEVTAGHSIGSGAIGAVVGRLGSAKRATDQAESEDTARVRSET